MRQVQSGISPVVKWLAKILQDFSMAILYIKIVDVSSSYIVCCISNNFVECLVSGPGIITFHLKNSPSRSNGDIALKCARNWQHKQKWIANLQKRNTLTVMMYNDISNKYSIKQTFLYFLAVKFQWNNFLTFHSCHAHG